MTEQAAKITTTTTAPTKTVNNNYAPSTYKQCWHDGDKVIWSYNGTNFVIADKYGIDHWANGVHADIILDLNKNLSPGGKPLIISGPERFKALNQYTIKPTYELVQIDWPDMSIVPANLTFWEEMLDALTESKKGTVMITCHGGHGRSGTALAALMVASGVSGKVAIARVRGKHCGKAVETTSQESYIKWLSASATSADAGIKADDLATLEDSPGFSIRPNEYCVHCGRDFNEPSLTSDTCTECAEDMELEKDLDKESVNNNAAAQNVFWPDADYTGANDDALYG